MWSTLTRSNYDRVQNRAGYKGRDLLSACSPVFLSLSIALGMHLQPPHVTRSPCPNAATQGRRLCITAVSHPVSFLRWLLSEALLRMPLSLLHACYVCSACFTHQDLHCVCFCCDAATECNMTAIFRCLPVYAVWLLFGSP